MFQCSFYRRPHGRRYRVIVHFKAGFYKIRGVGQIAVGAKIAQGLESNAGQILGSRLKEQAPGCKANLPAGTALVKNNYLAIRVPKKLRF
jgi:hypothetical protein